jgi:hypothetical protein
MPNAIDTTPADAPLSGDEQRTLAEHEAVIADGITTFLAVGASLAAIRDGRLYRVAHDSFPDYLAERWPQLGGRRQADRLIIAAEVNKDLRPIGLSVANEAQARELGGLPAEGRREAMRRATAQAGDKPPIAAQVRAAARAVAAEPAPEPLAAVAAALRHGTIHDAYAAAQAAGAHYDRAMAAVDARVEGRPLDAALAILQAPEDKGAPMPTMPTPATEPAPTPAPPAFDARIWSLYATAAGAKLMVYAHDYQLMTPDETRRRYTDDALPALMERISALMYAALASHAPHAPHAGRPRLPRIPPRPAPARDDDPVGLAREATEWRRWAHWAEDTVALLSGDERPAREKGNL